MFNLLGGLQDSGRDVEIEAAAILGNIARGEVDRYTFTGELQVIIGKSTPYTLLGFIDPRSWRNQRLTTPGMLLGSGHSIPATTPSLPTLIILWTFEPFAPIKRYEWRTVYTHDLIDERSSILHNKILH